MWDQITHPFPNFSGCTVEVWEWISNFIPHFTRHVITYPYWEWSQSMLVKGAPCIKLYTLYLWLFCITNATYMLVLSNLDTRSGQCKAPEQQQQWYWTTLFHGDVIKWKHFPRHKPFVWGIHRSPVNSQHKGQWRGALTFFLWSALE